MSSKVLLLFSNPEQTTRLRLDLEHRSIEDVLRNLQMKLETVRSIHATNEEDLIFRLEEHPYEIIQFSGHGSEQGFCLESIERKLITVDPKKMTEYLKTIPSLKLAFFVSCYSNSHIEDLIQAAPYIVTMNGTVSDEAAIKFTKHFYKRYFSTSSVEKAFTFASNLIDEDEEALNPILYQRATKGKEPHLLIKATFMSKPNCVIIDLSAVKDDMASLPIPKEEFLSLVSRKIRIHNWIFNEPRENAAIAIGPYIGIFSWEKADEIVYCNKVFQLKPNLDEKTCQTILGMMVAYNDLRTLRYRAPDLADPFNPIVLKSALERMNSFFEYYYNSDRKELLKALGADQFLVTLSISRASLDLAEQKYNENTPGLCIANLEATLSTFHDFLNLAIDQIVLKKKSP